MTTKTTTVRQLTKQFRQELEAYFGNGSTWQEYGCCESGGKRIVGPHTDIVVPGARPLTNQDVEFITQLYGHLIDERNVGVTVVPFQSGGGIHKPGHYTTITIEHRKLSDREKDASYPYDHSKD